MIGCATGGSTLDRIYPPGSPRDDVRARSARIERELAYTRRATEDAVLEPGAAARAALGERLEAAVGYDAWNARVKRGAGYNATYRDVCDLVFFDAQERIVASHRREGRC